MAQQKSAGSSFLKKGFTLPPPKKLAAGTLKKNGAADFQQECLLFKVSIFQVNMWLGRLFHPMPQIT